MRLYLLTRNGRVGWDENSGFVIRARSPAAARALAHTQGMYDPSDCWLDPNKTSCTVIPIDGDPAIILTDFNAG
jgi:hypothetical protein